MKLKLLREPSGVEATFGILLLDDYLECYTLENTHKIIPEGIYSITKYFSPHNKVEVPLLQGVMGRSEIEIHVANYAYELEGCIAVGRDFTRPMLINSRIVFNELMPKLRFDNLSIEIKSF